LRLPRLLREGDLLSVFNRLVDELERTIRQTATGTVTLAAGTTSTVVPLRVVTASSVVILTPANAAAAADQDWHVTATPGAFTVTHGNAASPRSLFYQVA
jgi:hypothetical protein